jgi:2-polyprenyl-6-methoxyphenol hydroxylase-like FAD-dependent oxidoreductase
MGVLASLQEAATSAPDLAFVSPSGQRIGPLRLGRPRGEDVEIPRADLASILIRAARDHAEFLFEEQITALHADDAGVNASFKHMAPRRFDLVVGADGLHSTVRDLAFGPETRFVRHLGLYIATLSLGRPAADPRTVLMYNQPGLSLTVHPVRGVAGAGFIFRGTERPGLDYNDPETQRNVIVDAYAKHVWRIPEVPELDRQVRDAKDLYSICRVHLPGWSRGRIALLGDAASCVSLFGDGSSLAMIGATTLAEALAAGPEDVVTAFRRYESHHRGLVNSRQRGYNLAAALLVPSSRVGLMLRNFTARLLPG